jgi:predicted HTH domain antitoxin
MSANCINLTSSIRKGFATVDTNAVRKIATTHTAKRWWQATHETPQSYWIPLKFLYLWIMKTLTLNIPDSLDVDNKDLAMLVASRLYEQGRLSLGQAAELANLSKRTFAELLGKYNVSIFNFPASDISRDVANA